MDLDWREDFESLESFDPELYSSAASPVRDMLVHRPLFGGGEGRSIFMTYFPGTTRQLCSPFSFSVRRRRAVSGRVGSRGGLNEPKAQVDGSLYSEKGATGLDNSLTV